MYRMRWPLWIGLIALVGCAEVTPKGPDSYPAQRALIGKTKQALLACAGPPIVERVKSDQVQLVYYREASQLEESFGGSKSSFAKVHHGCRATIVLQEDRVSEVRYENQPSSYREEDHCEDIFESCVGP